MGRLGQQCLFIFILHYNSVFNFSFALKLKAFVMTKLKRIIGKGFRTTRIGYSFHSESGGRYEPTLYRRNSSFPGILLNMYISVHKFFYLLPFFLFFSTKSGRWTEIGYAREEQ